MGRKALVAIAVLLGAGAVLWFMSARTHWEPATRYTPASLQALANPFYSELALMRELGVDARVIGASEPLPAPGGTALLYQWNWDTHPEQRERLKRWVHDGGRLIVDRTMVRTDDFERWSGLELVDIPASREERPDEAAQNGAGSEDEAADPQAGDEETANADDDTDDTDTDTEEDDSCVDLHEGGAADGAGSLRFCSPWTGISYWRDTHGANWSMDADTGSQLRRYPVGAGSVTGINSYPWQLRALFEADHAVLLARALQLRRGDRVVFIRGDRSPSLLYLVWKYGAPVLLLALAAVALAIWRAMPRFGPQLQSATQARRSLREQITGTAEFLRRHGGTLELWRASVAALDQELARHLPLQLPLSEPQRLQALEALTATPPARLAEALGAEANWRAERLARAVGVLEGLRRGLLARNHRAK